MTPDPTGEVISAAKYEFALYLETEGGWYIAIENEFTLSLPDGTSLSIAQAQSAQIVQALQKRVGQRLESCVIADNGALTLTIGDTVLHVEPRPKYESWNLAGPDKQLIVCMPGGELAIWS